MSGPASRFSNFRGEVRARNQIVVAVATVFIDLIAITPANGLCAGLHDTLPKCVKIFVDDARDLRGLLCELFGVFLFSPLPLLLMQAAPNDFYIHSDERVQRANKIVVQV